MATGSKSAVITPPEPSAARRTHSWHFARGSPVRRTSDKQHGFGVGAGSGEGAGAVRATGFGFGFAAGFVTRDVSKTPGQQ